MNIRFGLQHESYKHKYDMKYMMGNIDNRNESLTEKKSIYIDVAKNDMAAFQVIAIADEAISVTVGDEPYFSAADIRNNLRVAVLESPLDIAMNPIGAVTDDDTLKKSDIILKSSTVECNAHEPCCIWTEAKIGENVLAGEYKGSIAIYYHRVFGDEKLLGTLDFTITVHNVTIPTGDERKFFLDLWQHNSNIARKHEVPLYSDRHFDILEGYVKSLGDLGQSVVTVIASEIPWSGQRCFCDPNLGSDLFEYSMIKVVREADGKFEYDFSIMQRYIDLCFKYGINREIEVFGLCNIWINDDEDYTFRAEGYPEYVRIRYFDKNDSTYKYMSDSECIKAYVSALEAYFVDKGYIDIVRIVADEPADMERYHKSVDAVRRAGKHFKYKTAVNHAEFIQEFKDKISDFVPGLFCTAENYNLLHHMTEERMHRILWYVCCEPKVPNTFVCSNLLEARSIGYLTKFLGFDGFLRWNYTVWPSDPRRDLRYRYPDWRCGDTNFVYPSHGGEVMLSIRYKALMRGILDYELLCMTEQAGGGELVKEAIAKLIKVNAPSELIDMNKKDADEVVSLESDEYDFIKKKMIYFLENR